MKDLPDAPPRGSLEGEDEEFPAGAAAAKLAGFAGASFGAGPRKMRSATGIVFAFCGGAIAYQSKTQTITAGSSAEAEFIAAHSAGKAARHLRLALAQLGCPQKGPTPAYIDNESALKIINDNISPTERTRHMDLSFFAISTKSTRISLCI